MKTRTVSALALTLIAAGITYGQNYPPGNQKSQPDRNERKARLRQDLKKAGQNIGEAATEVGQAISQKTKRVGATINQGVDKAGNAIHQEADKIRNRRDTGRLQRDSL